MADDSIPEESGTKTDFSLDSSTDDLTEETGTKTDFSLTEQPSVTATFDTVIKDVDVQSTFTEDAAIALTDQSTTFSEDAIILNQKSVTFTEDTVVEDRDVQATFTEDTAIADLDQTITFTEDTVIQDSDLSVTTTHDTVIEDKDAQATFTEDVAIQDRGQTKGATFDAVIANIDQEKTFVEDAAILTRASKTFSEDAYIAHGRPGAVTVYIDGTEYKKYANIKIKKRLNEMNDIEFEAYIEDSNNRSLIQEGATVEIFEGADNLLFKGRLENVEYDSNFKASCEGFAQEVKFLNRKTARTEYDNKAADTIIKNLVTSEIMNEGTIESAPSISIRFDHDNKLRAIAGVANAIGYDWYINQKKSEGYDKDYLNFVARKGSDSSQKTYDIGGNAQMVERNKDTEHVANDITMLGRGDGINQLEVNVFAASTHRTVTTERLSDTDTTALDLKDASQLGSDGDTVHVRVGSEVIEGTLDTTNNQLDISARGANDYDGNSTETITHYKDIQVWLQENVTQGTGPFKPTKSGSEDGSSIDSFGVREEKITDRTIINKSTLEKVADNELKDRRQDVFRVQIKPTDPRTTKEIELGDDVTAKDLTAMDVDDEFRVVGMDINRASGAEGTVLHLANRPLRLTERLRDIKRETDTTSTHMQGATNIDSQNFGDNCGNSHPLKTEVRIPEDAVAVNKAELYFSREPFRGYVQNTDHSHTVSVNHPEHDHDVSISDTSSSSDTGEWQNKITGVITPGQSLTDYFLIVETTASPTGSFDGAAITATVFNNSGESVDFDWELINDDDGNNTLDSGSKSLSNNSGYTTNYSADTGEISANDSIKFDISVTNGNLDSEDTEADLTVVELVVASKSTHDHDVSDTSTSTKALGTTTSETSGNSGAPSYGIFEPSSEPDVDVNVIVDGNTVTTINDLYVGQTVSPIDIKSELSEPIAGKYHSVKLEPVDTGGGNGGRCRLNATVFNKVFVESKL